MTLFYDPAGPLMQWSHGFLDIKDLNPENEMRWRMSRADVLLLGLKCLLAAIRG